MSVPRVTPDSEILTRVALCSKCDMLVTYTKVKANGRVAWMCNTCKDVVPDPEDGSVASPPPEGQAAPAQPEKNDRDASEAGETALQKLSEERQRRYGDPRTSFRALGKQWTALIERHYEIELPHDIPGHVVCAMIAELKLNRVVTPAEYHADSYVDAMNYVRLGNLIDARRPK